MIILSGKFLNAADSQLINPATDGFESRRVLLNTIVDLSVSSTAVSNNMLS